MCCRGLERARRRGASRPLPEVEPQERRDEEDPRQGPEARRVGVEARATCTCCGESVPYEPKLVPVGTEPLADDSDTVPRMERHQHGHLLHRQHYARQLVALVRQ